MQSFKEITFPKDIPYVVSGGPEFQTYIETSINGFELRNLNWHSSRMKYNLTLSMCSKMTITNVQNFFWNMQGRVTGFRFYDHLDYAVKNEFITVIKNKNNNVFQLIKHYGSYKRTITKPVINTVKIYLNKQQVDAEINFLNGTFTINKELLLEEMIVTADFEFDVPVRFDNDFLEVKINDFNSYSIENLKLVELKL